MQCWGGYKNILYRPEGWARIHLWWVGGVDCQPERVWGLKL